MVFGDLGDLQQTQFPVILDQRATLKKTSESYDEKWETHCAQFVWAARAQSLQNRFFSLETEPEDKNVTPVINPHANCLNSVPPYLDVSTCLIRHLHDELAPLAVGLADQVVQDVEVDGGSEVVDVGHEDVLSALRDQFFQKARIVEAGVDVTVARGVPALCVVPIHAQVGGHRKEGFFVDARIPREEGGPQCDQLQQFKFLSFP